MKWRIIPVIVLLFLISCTNSQVIPAVVVQNNVTVNNTLVTPVTITIEGNSSYKPITLDSNDQKELSNWNIIYDGDGNVSTSDNHILLSPNPNILGNETHSALVTYYRNMPEEYVLDLKLVVHKQFRSNPNPWEAGWVLFNYEDSSNFYYFIPKTNGIELGRFVDGKQEFLFNADSPKISLKIPSRIKLVLNNGRLDAFVNSIRVVHNYPINVISNAKVGLYSEDSEVEFLDVKSYKP